MFDYTLSICSSAPQRDVDSKEAEQLKGINQIVYLLRVPCRVQQHIISEGKLSKQGAGRETGYNQEKTGKKQEQRQDLVAH